tara:strand:- start:3074 stop:4288 length:1215 start_codon:yes stop_codon:yes gene_type:complete
MVRPIDLLFQRDASMRPDGMDFTPRVTYGETEPVSTNPLRITINPSGRMPKPRLQTPDNTTSLLGANTGGTSMFDPATFGLLGASAELLRQGGFSKTPVSFGEGIGNAFNAGLQNYLAMNQAQQKMNQPVAVPKGGMLVNPRTGQVVVDGRNQGGFEGSGITNQSFNTLLNLSDRIRKGNATNIEKQKYRLAYGYLSKPVNETINMADGTVKQIQRPAQDLTGFFNPFPDQQSGKTVVGEKPSAQKLKILENRPKLTQMLGNLNEYTRKLQNLDKRTQLSGIVGLPTAEATAVSSLAETLRLDIKNLYELGALVGGDFQILDNLLTSPNSTQGLAMGTEGLLQQLYTLENTLLNKLKQGGFDEPVGSQLDPIPIAKPEDWNKAQFGLYYKLPDNSVKLKVRKRN